MITLKYIFGCLIGYYLALFLFFTTEFVSYPQINQISNKTLTQSIGNSNLNPKNIPSNGKQPQTTKSIEQVSQQASNPRVSQVVFIIIDALRYDYINRMRFFNQTLNKYPKTTLLKKSIVGNPTMTTQRIQSIMTGSQIFTQTNILDMFLSQKKQADNLISQFRRSNKTVTVFGDDTWVKLFNFEEGSHFVCDSTFNIRDYDACDELIYDNLHRFIRTKKDKVKTESQQKGVKYSENKTVSLLIAHFLALDHIGHSTSSISAPQMNDKMERISLYLEYLIKMAEQNTMFIITGDHGMRQDGNHGGNSRAERESLLFAYYKPKDQNERTEFSQRVINFEGGLVSQVDLTATISVLLDVPNPINSIGCPIIEILPQEFEPYLTTIIYNTLEQYKILVQHYSQLSGSKTNQHTFDKCVRKITSKQQELLQLAPDQQTFTQMMKSKQFIKTQIQFSECLGERLSMVEPNLFIVWVSLMLMGVFFILLVGKGVYCELQQMVRLNQGQRMRPLAIEVIGWMGSLFIVYFSWYLIRNSSTYMLLFIILMVLMISNKSLSLGKKIQFIFLILLLTQFEPERINEYELNYFNLNFVENIVSFLNRHIPTSPSGHFNPSQDKQIQLRQLKSLLHIFCVSVWIMVKLKRSLYSLRTLKKRSRKDNDNEETKKRLLMIKLLETVIIIGGYLILLLEGFSNGQLIGLVGSKKLAEQIDVLEWVVFMRYVVFSLIIAKCINQSRFYKSYRQTSQQHIKQNQNNRQFNILITFSIIVGLQNFIPLMIFTAMVSTILSHNFIYKKSILLSTQKKLPIIDKLIDNHCLNQSLTIGFRVVLISLISEYMWWIFGNRYEYSSIDIRKSYLFSVSFNIYLNAVAMGFWFMAPYLIAITFIDQKLSQLAYIAPFYQSSNKKQKQRQVEQQEQSLKTVSSQSSHFPEVTKNTLNKDWFKSQNEGAHHQWLLSNLVKFMYVFMAGLLSAALNLVINNNKILFTVVYVPLLVFGILKVVIIALFLSGILLYRTNSVHLNKPQLVFTQ